MLHEAGFPDCEFFATFPDYKLPKKIISLADGGIALNQWLLFSGMPSEHNGYDGSSLDPAFQISLADHYRTLAAEGIAQHFVPSFFVRAS